MNTAAFFRKWMDDLTDRQSKDGKTHCIEQKYYTKYAIGARKAYEYLFVKNGDIETERQAKLVRPLAMNLLSPEVKKRVYQRFVELLKVRNYTIGTGFLSTPFVLPLLSEN